MQSPISYSEFELVENLKAHDENAFIFLYDNYYKALFTVIHAIVESKDTSEDILQEVFVKIWQNIISYDPSKGRLYTWMINIARNKAIDCIRSKETTNKSKTIELSDNVYDHGSETSKIEDIGLKRVLNELPPQTRKLMELAYFQGYTQDEISKILGIPIGTVKTRIRTTLIHLRKILGVKK